MGTNKMTDYEIVYLVQHKDLAKYTKIGFTTRKDLTTRLNELNTASPTGIIVIKEYHVPIGKAFVIEQSLHKQYKSYQSNLEWYELTTEHIKKIDEWMTKILNK